VRRAARRTGPAPGGDGLHPAALPHPAALLPDAAAGAGDRWTPAPRPRDQHPDPPRPGRTGAAPGLLVGAAARHAAVGADLHAAGCAARGPRRALVMAGPGGRRLRNPESEARLFRRRALFGFAVVLLSLAGLAGW